MVNRIGLSPKEARTLRASYVGMHGTTLTGLMGDFPIDPADYLTYVHQLDYEALIHPDPELRRALEVLPQARYVFTNGSAEHARNTLDALRLTDLFRGIIDIVALDYANKPDPKSYTRALALIGAPDPEACLLADDRIQNLGAASALGMTTVLVGPGPSEAADARVDRLADLPNALPWLLDPIFPADDGHG